MWLLFLLFIYFFLTSKSIYKSNIEFKSNERGHIWIKRKNIFYILIFIFISFFSSLRLAKEGTDTYVYLNIFKNIDKYDFSNIEHGYYLLNRIIYFISDNYQFFLFIVTSIIYLNLYSFLNRYSKHIRISLLLFILLGYFDNSLNLIRQLIAISIVLYSYKYILSRNFIKFLLIIILASLFHKTSFIFIFAYFLYKIPYKRNIWKYYIVCLIPIFLVSSYLFDFIQSTGLYGEYFTSSEFGIQDSIKLAPLLNFIQCFCIIITSLFLLKSNDKKSYFLIVLLMFGSFFTLTSFRFTQIDRLSFYYSIFTILLIPNIYINNKKKTTFYYLIFWIVILIMRYLLVSFLRPEWSGVYPYKFYFL